jgi:hypothetical protein
LLTAEYTAINLTPGVIYEFKIESRNSYDYSSYSDVLTMLCAFKPEPPAAPTTYRTTNQMNIDWVEPFTNGSPITGYRIYILEHDSVTYTQESVECDGTSSTVISNTFCQVSLSNLIIAPYEHVLDESVWVKIIAENFYGDSLISDTGNGGLVKLVPDAPINLANDATVTIDTLIKFTWEEGASNGGDTVLDFSIYYDQGTGSGTYVLLDSNIVTAHYTTTVTLNPGTTYSFKTTARNTVGSGLQSEAISILAAKPPDAPIQLNNIPQLTTGYQIGLTWLEGAYDGGSQVIDYRLWYKPSTDSEYTIYADGIQYLPYTITGLTPSVIYDIKVQARNVVEYGESSEALSILAA